MLLQLKESASKNTDVQHQLEKAKQQHQELQALQQNTNGKLREAQVLSTRKTPSANNHDKLYSTVSFFAEIFYFEKHCLIKKNCVLKLYKIVLHISYNILFVHKQKKKHTGAVYPVGGL